MYRDNCTYIDLSGLTTDRNIHVYADRSESGNNETLTLVELLLTYFTDYKVHRTICLACTIFVKN